ncbi:T9SS type B sorting domain-containing protein, partial [Sphingobacterium olei]
AGAVYNVAVAKGKDPKDRDVEGSSTDNNPLDPTDPDNPPVDPNCPECTIVEIDQEGAIEVIKTADLSQRFRYAGEQIAYEILIKNVGNVTLHDIKVTDANADDVNVGNIANLAVGESVTLQAYHTITQADMERGYVSNVAIASGKDPKDRDVIDESVSGNVPEAGDPIDPDCTNCTIAPLPWKVIEANNDTPAPVNGKDGSTTPSVLDNDMLNGSPVIPAEVTLTPGTSPHTGIVMNPDGTVTVSAETPAGTYTYPYTICEVLNPSNCDNAVVTILVEAAVIEANNDTPAPVNGKDGGTTPSVLDNDMLNGSPVIPAEVTLTPGTSPHTGIVMNPDGTVTVSAETPAGTYTYPYTICEVLNPSNCDNAVVTILVEAAVIEANNDTPAPVNGKDGGTTPSVLDNDMLNGSPVIPSEVTLTPGTSPHTGITMNPDGTVTVSAETPAGTYTYPYTICEVLNPSNCDNAVMTIVVEAAVIEANDDTPAPINGKDGGTTPSVLDNDMLNGSPVIPSEVTLTWSPDNVESPAIILNTDGTVTVLPETPEGIYEFSYRICEVLNPTNCDEAAITIVIEPAPIVAMDDNIQIEWDRTSIITMSVLDNDAFNGGSIDLNEVTLTPGVPSDPNLSMNADGTINIPASTRPGTYTYPYTICEVLNPSNCSTAVATIVIEASNLFIPNVITPNGDGQNDRFEIIGSENYDRVEVTIVNRWGNEIFRNDNYDNNWTGRGLNEGTYYYIIKLYKGSKVEQHKGWVLIKTH